MIWSVIAILAYFLLALTAIVDEVFLTKSIIKPKVYAFYVGILSIVVFVLVPFGFKIPSGIEIALALLSGFLWIFALIAVYEALRLYEVSRIVPAVGGVLPIFTLGISYLFAWQTRETITSLNYWKVFSFLLLILGSILIAWEKKENVSKKSFGLAVLAAFLFALSFATAKMVYLSQSFVSGLIWMRFGSFLAALLLIFSKDIREELFKKKEQPKEKKQPLFKKPKMTILFVLNQSLGAGAGILQNLAIYLAPLSMLAFVNALEGTKYVFLLALTILFSVKFPKILTEKISKPIIWQKIFAIVLILSGLIILVIN